MLPLVIIQERMAKLKDWALEMDCIVKDYEFCSFKEAVEFVNKVKEVSDKQQHYPMLIVTEGMVKISLTTHSEKGLTSKDFELAEELDKLQ